MTPYVDGEASALDRREVRAHLVACPICRARAASEGAARQVLRARAASFREQAPVGLRTRVVARVQEARAGAPPWWSVRRFATLPAAAALVLFVAVAALVGLGGRSATLLAAELTLDHWKCFSLFERASAAPDDRAIEERLRDRYGWRVDVPGSAGVEGLTLVGGRRCAYHEGGIAHVMYRFRGAPVSLFMLPETSKVPAEVRVFGHEARIWTRGGATYVLVAARAHDEVDRLAEFLHSTVR